MLSDRSLSVCNVGVLWPNGSMNQDETWHASRPWSWPHGIRWGPSPSPKMGQSPQFSAHICCAQMAGWIKVPLGREVGLSSSNVLLDASFPQKGRTPQFSAHVNCGQTAGLIKMALGTEVGLGPATFVRWGPNSPKKVHGPQFLAHV